MRRRVLSLIALASLLLFTADIALWVWTQRTGASVTFQTSTHTFEMTYQGGRLMIGAQDGSWIGVDMQEQAKWEAVRKKPRYEQMVKEYPPTREIVQQAIDHWKQQRAEEKLWHFHRSARIPPPRRWAHSALGFGVVRSYMDVDVGVRGHWVVVPLWTILAISTLAPAWWLFSRLRRRRGHCPTCNYNLTGNTSGVCPECGTVIGGKVGT